MNEITSEVLTSVSNLQSDTSIPTTGNAIIAVKQEVEDDSYDVVSTVSPESVPSNIKMDQGNRESFYKEHFNLKNSCVLLEKCDKIWETLKVIKNLQLTHPSEKNDENYAAAFQDAMHNHSKPSTPEPMQYHPVLNNGNAALPNFQFAIKSWKRLYTCSYCDKQYTDNRNLRVHVAKVHAIISISNEVSRSKEVPSIKEVFPSKEESKDFPRPKEIPCPKRVSGPKSFSRRKQLSQLKEMVRSKKNLSKPHVCQTCGVGYVEARSLAAHSLREHGILTELHERWLAQQSNPNDYTVEDLLKRHSCYSCGKRYSCMKSLRLHYLKEHNVVVPLMRGGRNPQAFVPPIPNKQVTNVKHTGDLQKHMNICTICGKKYTKNWYLRVHCLEVHGIPMQGGKGKNSNSKLRVIKKEVEEPEQPRDFLQSSDKKTAGDALFLPPKKSESIQKNKPKSVIITPLKRLLKRYQCTSCKKEFMSISKLRNHAYARHGIVIPMLRKPYKKHKPLNTPANVTIKVEESNKNLITTPKQVSLDRYFKSPASGGSTFSKINPTFASPQNAGKELSKAKVPAKDSTPARVEVLPKEKTPKASTLYVKCTLCARKCKDIRKHVIDYHKIRCPETVMKDTPFFTNNTTKDTSGSQVPEGKADVMPKSELIPKPGTQQMTLAAKSQKKRRRKMLTLQRRKRRRTEEPAQKLLQSPVLKAPLVKNAEAPRRFSPVKTANKCTICNGYYATAKSLRVHRQKHRMKGETKENIHLIKHNYKNIIKPPQVEKSSISISTFDESALIMDTNIDVENESRTSYNGSIAHSSSSESRDSNRRSTRLSINSYSLSETTCECGRAFRDPHTLFLHKEKCRTAHKIEEKMLVARSSSDRDSGIGISITIKKKNDSYEIVSRDSGDDDKSKDSSASKDSDQMSQSSDTNSYELNFDGRKYPDFVSPQCSKDHSILKIEVAEDDVDVDIEDDSQPNDSSDKSKLLDIEVAEVELKADNASNHSEQFSSFENDLNENRIPDPLEMDLYRCAACLELFGNKEDLAEHVSTHEKRASRQECPCGKTFRGVQTFLTHVRENHPRWLQCGYCDATFSNVKEYYSHFCGVNEGKDFQDLQGVTCHCCKSKVRMMNFDSHVKREHLVPEKPYLCYYCNMRFFNSTQRRAHLNAEHVKPSCKVCGKTLRFDFAAKHEAYHAGLGFPCHVCKKAFTSSKLANSHKYEVHVREDKECEVCHKKVSHRHLRIHMRSHTNKDSCKICKKGFISNRTLQDHIELQHKNIYPFVKCDSCRMSFTSERYLERHFAQDLCVQTVKQNLNIKEYTKSNVIFTPVETSTEKEFPEPIKILEINEASVFSANNKISESGESSEINKILESVGSSEKNGILKKIEVSESVETIDITDMNENSEKSKVSEFVETIDITETNENSDTKEVQNEAQSDF